MNKYYEGLTTRMRSEIKTISDAMSHHGEKGRNNELVLKQFLEQHLAKQYTVSTGKVLSAEGDESDQVDLIIHDRQNAPELVLAHAWRLVPIETVFAVISVKTTLNRPELRCAMASIESVRKLPRTAAFLREGNRKVPIPENQVLRPRGFVFAFQSSWATPNAADVAFRELLEEFHDDHRPNGVCILDECFIPRKPFTVETMLFSQHSLMHFFVVLSDFMDSRPRYTLDLMKYFREDYGQA